MSGDTFNSRNTVNVKSFQMLTKKLSYRKQAALSTI